MTTAVATIDPTVQQALATVQQALALVPKSLDDMLAVPVVREDCGEADDQFLSIPYVGFRGKKSFKNKEALDAAGIAVQDFYLHDTTAIRVKPLGLHLLSVARFYTVNDNQGRPKQASYQTDDSLFEDGFREYLLGVVLVALPPADPKAPSHFVPAMLNLYSAQTRALKVAMALVGKGGAAVDAAMWSARGTAYAASSRLRHAGTRFRTEIWSTEEKPQGDGEPFNMGHGRTYPTPERDFGAIEASLTGEPFEKVRKVFAVYNLRIAELQKLANA